MAGFDLKKGHSGCKKQNHPKIFLPNGDFLYRSPMKGSTITNKTNKSKKKKHFGGGNSPISNHCNQYVWVN